MNAAHHRRWFNTLVLMAVLSMGCLAVAARAQTPPAQFPLVIPPACAVGSSNPLPTPLNYGTATPCRLVDPYGPVTTTVVDISGSGGTVTFAGPHSSTTVPGCVVAAASDPYSCPSVTNYAADVSVSWPAQIASNGCRNGGTDCNFSLWWRTIFQEKFQPAATAPLILTRIGTCGMRVLAGVADPPSYPSDETCSYQVQSSGTGGVPALTSVHFPTIITVPGMFQSAMAFNECFSGCIRVSNIGVPPFAGRPTSTGTVAFVRTDADGGAPTADFTIVPSASAPNAVTVDASPSTAPAGTTLTTFDWTFEGGGNATGRQATHTFADANQHAITLTVTASNGKTASVTKRTTGTLVLVVNSSGDRSDSDLTKPECDTGGVVGTDAECTLRAALETAARSSGGARISFDIATTPTISIGSPLPVVSVPTVLDATTQPAGRVRLTGSGQFGIQATRTVTVKGFAIDGFACSIFADVNTPGSVFTGNTIDTGTGNCIGIYARGGGSIIGGTGADGNDITTIGYGILAANGSTISGNTIGRTATTIDKAPIHGIIVAGFVGSNGESAGRISGNVVTAKSVGIWLIDTKPAGTIVESNRIGITAAGTESPVGGSAGVLVDGTPDVVVRSNVVNAYCGVQVNGSDRSVSTDSGALLSETCSEAVSTGPITATDVEVSSNTIGLLPDGDTPTRGFAKAAISLRHTTGTVVRNNLLARADSGVVVRLGSGQQVTGNKINVNTTATRTYPDAYPNTMGTGVVLDGVADVQVGALNAPNVIAGTTDAIATSSRPSLGLTITGNVLGIGSGDAPLPNGRGLFLSGTAITVDSNVIGASSREGALFNDVDGLTFTNNTIGLNAARTTAVANQAGITVLHTNGGGNKNIQIGPGNVIAGNTDQAVLVNPASNVTVSNNLIGTNGAGATLPNGAGVLIAGTTVDVSDNTISANTGDPLTISDAATLALSGNRVGVTPAGSASLPNRGGVAVRSVGKATISDNTIGGSPGIGLEVAQVNELHLTGNRIGVAGAASAVVANQTGAVLDRISTGDVTGNTFSGNTAEGLWLRSVADAVTIEGNRFGTSTDGSRAAGNSVGVRLSGTSATLGKNNVIAGNRGSGVYSEAVRANITGSSIGVGANGSTALPNGDGVTVVSGALTLRSSTVANSANIGVKVSADAAADLLGNRVFANTTKGIAATHRIPPVLVAAPRRAAGDDTTTWLVVSGLTGVTEGRMEAFANNSCSDPEGRFPIGSLTLPDPLKSGDGLVWPIHGQPDRHFLTVTLTVNGKTTGFSNCIDADATAADTDGDGVPDTIENIGDSTAANDPKSVALPVEGKGWVVIQGTGALRGVGTVDDPSPSGHPGIDLPYGVLSFSVTPDASGKATVSITTQNATPDAYWKYGSPTPGDAPTWYRFDIDDVTHTGATRTVGTSRTGPFTRFDLNLVDGARGDTDGRRNGLIVDPGGPAMVSPAAGVAPSPVAAPPSFPVGSADAVADAAPTSGVAGSDDSRPKPAATTAASTAAATVTTVTTVTTVATDAVRTLTAEPGRSSAVPELSYTGSDTGPLVLAALVLFAVGATLLVMVRRPGRTRR